MTTKRSDTIHVPDKIEHRPITSLKPYPKNAKIHTESQIDDLAAVIRRVGWTKPIIIDEHSMILAGHGAAMAARKLKMSTVPCIVRAGLTDAEKRAYIIADNKLPESAKWDEAILRVELKEIALLDFPISVIGFSPPELTKLTAEKLDFLPGKDGEPGDDEDDEHAEDENHLTPEGRGDHEPQADEKRDYKQKPPEDATRAIRGSEERIPLAILLDREEHDKWLAFKKEANIKLDKDGFRILMGWPLPVMPSTDPAADPKAATPAAQAQ